MEAEDVARDRQVAGAALDLDVLAAILQMNVESLDSCELELAVDAGSRLRAIVLDMLEKLE